MFSRRNRAALELKRWRDDRLPEVDVVGMRAQDEGGKQARCNVTGSLDRTTTRSGRVEKTTFIVTGEGSAQDCDVITQFSSVILDIKHCGELRSLMEVRAGGPGVTVQSWSQYWKLLLVWMSSRICCSSSSSNRPSKLHTHTNSNSASMSRCDYFSNREFYRLF